MDWNWDVVEWSSKADLLNQVDGEMGIVEEVQVSRWGSMIDFLFFKYSWDDLMRSRDDLYNNELSSIGIIQVSLEIFLLSGKHSCSKISCELNNKVSIKF